MGQTSIFADRRGLIAFATLCCLLWGSAVPAVKFGYGLMTGRAIRLTSRRFGEVALLGLGQTTIQYVCYYVGLAHTTAVKTSIISSTLVFFSVLLAHFIYADDKLTGRRVLGCLIGFAGVVAVNVASGSLDFHFSLLGEGLLLISTFAGSLAAIYGRRLSRDMDAAVMTGWQLLLGGVVLTVMGLVGGGHFESFSIGAGVLVLYLASVSAVAFALWSLLLKHNPVSDVAIFNFEIPVFGVILSALVLGESIFEWKNLVALVLVCLGIWLVTSRGRSAPSGTPAP